MGRFPKLGTDLSPDFRNSYNTGTDLVDEELEKQKKRVDDLISGAEQPSEVVDARGGFNLLSERLDDTTAQLAEKATHEVTEDYINVLKPPAPYLPLQIGLSSTYGDSNPVRLQALLDNLVALKKRKLFFPVGVYYFNTGVTVKCTRVQFVGVFNDIDTRHGSQLVYHGSSDFVTIGTTTIPTSQYGDNLYSGLEHFTLKDILLEAGSTNTPLNNASGNNYKAGSRGLVDWGGGCLSLINATIQRFEYGAYLVQSDFNEWDQPKFLYNKCAVYISSRSDQNIWIRPDFTQNETALWVDGALNLVLNSANFVKNGAGGTYGDIPPVKMTNGSLTMYAPWIESLNLRTNETLPCIIRAGVDVGWNNTLTNCIAKVYDPQVTVGVSNLFEFNKANVEINGIQEVTTQLNSLAFKKGTEIGSFFHYIGNTTYDLTKILKSDVGATNAYVNGVLSAYGQMRFKGTRYYFDHPSNTNMNFYLGASGDKKITLECGGRLLFDNISLKVMERGSVPVSGDFIAGDYCRNTTPTELGTAGSKYVVKGWIRLTTGSTHVLNTDWVEDRALTGN